MGLEGGACFVVIATAGLSTQTCICMESILFRNKPYCFIIGYSIESSSRWGHLFIRCTYLAWACWKVVGHKRFMYIKGLDALKKS